MSEKKFMDKVKYFIGFNNYEDEEEYEEEGETGGYEGKPQPTASNLYPTASSTTSQGFDKNSNNAANKLVNINKSGNLKVVIYQPKSFEDTRQIVDNLKGKRPVILNIEQLDKEMARKIFDFCSGALYALDGHIQQISRGIFILAPNNIDVTGDIKSELESKGVFTWNSLKD